MKDIFLNRKKSDRSGLLDSLRGITVISMVLFHGMWDVYYLFDVNAEWFRGVPGFIWQQLTCCAFIFLSGFCGAMGRRTLRRGLMVFALGMGITAITVFFTPEERIWFGVLTMIGSCMMLVGLAKSTLLKVPAKAGLCVSLFLFLLTRDVNEGYIGILFWEWMELPAWFYQNYVTTYLGFPFEGFYSSDYFSLMPWLFLFLGGFYFYGICGKQVMSVKWQGFSALNFIGRHALLIYVLHQPIIYGLLSLWA